MGNNHVCCSYAISGKELKDVQIVQLKGGLSHTRSNTYASEINELFAKAFHAEGRALLLPVIFDTQELKEITEKIAI